MRADAWCGEAATGALHEGSLAWGLRRDLPPAKQVLAPAAVNLADWPHPKVGWGVVLCDRDDVSGADKASGADALEPIRALLAARAPAPVLRYRPDLSSEHLRRYNAAGKGADLTYGGARGLEPNVIPRYLLIVGSPAEIPWSAQYRMQTDAFVGRLDLDAEGLAHYVEALLGGWDTAAPDARRPRVWAVDHGYPDITRLMRKCIAERVRDRFVNDPDHEFDMGEDSSPTRRRPTTGCAPRLPPAIRRSS